MSKVILGVEVLTST